MSISLKPHNVETYKKVTDKLKKSNKVAVIHPTGTGKMYIALKLLEENNMTSYTITKKHKIVGQATWKKIHEGGHVDTRTIEAFCKLLNCQPGDLIEYIPDEDNTVSGVDKTINSDEKSQNHDS